MPNTTALQYYHGECCCCLEQGDHSDVTKLYYWDEQPEIYEVLFKDTFDIVLKYPENTKLICDCCIVKLREAKHFRSMVESSQQSLIDRVNWQTEFVNVVEEPSEESICSIKHEPDDDVEGVPVADHLNIQDHCVDIEIKTENIKCDPDSRVEAVDNEEEVDSECTVGQVHVTEETDIKEENSDPSTSSSHKRAITQKMKNLKVLPTRNPTLRRYSCKDCQYKTTCKTSLLRHMYNNTEQNIFSCNICHYKSPRARADDLARHMRSHYKCSCKHCQNITAIKRDLAKHKLTHTSCTGETTSFSCGYCQYKTTQKINLTRHILDTHSTRAVTLLSCNCCQYKAKYKAHLVEHMRSHTGEKPFACDICQFKTSRKGSLTRHLSTHN